MKVPDVLIVFLILGGFLVQTSPGWSASDNSKRREKVVPAKSETLLAQTEAKKTTKAKKTTEADPILEERPVEVIHMLGDRVYVRGALEAGDSVVLEGLHRLVVGQTVSVVEAN